MTINALPLKSKFGYIWISVLVLLLDQITKLIVKTKLPLYESKQVLGEFLLLTHVQNTGAAFSISLGNPATNRIFFVIVTMIALGFVVYLIIRSTSALQRISLCFIIGGALGNLIDRILYGYVTDFLDADFPDFIMQRWPVFNIADSAIVIAMALLILDMIINKEPLSAPVSHYSDIDSSV